MNRFAEPPRFDQLLAISPLSKARLKSVLTLFKSAGVVKEDNDERLQLLRPDLTAQNLARLAGNERDRDERDRLKQRRMVEYAERRACRWTGVLDYLGQDSIEKSCGHCDACG